MRAGFGKSKQLSKSVRVGVSAGRGPYVVGSVGGGYMVAQGSGRRRKAAGRKPAANATPARSLGRGRMEVVHPVTGELRRFTTTKPGAWASKTPEQQARFLDALERADRKAAERGDGYGWFLALGWLLAIAGSLWFAHWAMTVTQHGH